MARPVRSPRLARTSASAGTIYAVLYACLRLRLSPNLSFQSSFPLKVVVPLCKSFTKSPDMTSPLTMWRSCKGFTVYACGPDGICKQTDTYCDRGCHEAELGAYCLDDPDSASPPRKREVDPPVNAFWDNDSKAKYVSVFHISNILRIR